MKIPSLRQLLVLVAAVSLLAFGLSAVSTHAGPLAAVLLFLAVNVALAPAASATLGATTLTSQEILLDVIKGFVKWFPGFGCELLHLRRAQLSPCLTFDEWRFDTYIRDFSRGNAVICCILRF